MPRPITDIAVFSTTEAYREDISILDPVFQLSSGVEGLHNTLHGLQIEDPHVGYVLHDWETIDHHKKQVEDESTFGPVKQAAAIAVSGESVRVVHVEFASEPKALSSAVTEIGFLTLKSPEKKDDLIKLLSSWGELSQGMLTYGQTVEDENVFVLVCGWPSMEAHNEAQQSAVEQVALLHELVDSNTGHVSLTSYAV